MFCANLISAETKHNYVQWMLYWAVEEKESVEISRALCDFVQCITNEND